MSIVSIIGMAFSAIKLIIEIIGLIKSLKKADSSVNASELMGELRDAVKHLKLTGSSEKLEVFGAAIKKRCEGIGCKTEIK